MNLLFTDKGIKAANLVDALVMAFARERLTKVFESYCLERDVYVEEGKDEKLGECTESFLLQYRESAKLGIVPSTKILREKVALLLKSPDEDISIGIEEFVNKWDPRNPNKITFSK